MALHQPSHLQIRQSSSLTIALDQAAIDFMVVAVLRR
jgi:hypothetical protein